MPGPSKIPAVLMSVTSDPLIQKVTAVLTEKRRTCTATTAGRDVGLPSRFALARRLRTAGVIPFVELRQWLEIDQALRQLEEEGESPSHASLAMQADPAAFYHRVRRLTGHPWTEVRKFGSAWLMARFAERCTQRLAETNLADAQRVGA